MIANQVKGKGFGGAASYILDKSHDPQIIGGNMAGETARELASEFRVSRELRPTLKRAVYHVSLSVPIADKLSDQKWREIGEDYLKKMGFTDNQFVMVRHNDTQETHDHVHILASRIRFDGSVVSESQDYRRSASIIQALEKEHHLTRAAQTPEQAWNMDQRPLRPEATKAVLDQMKRTPESVEVPAMIRIQEAITEAVKTGRMDQFISRLEEQGIGIKGNIQSTGRISGVSFIADGTPIKGSDLGKNFSWKGLQEKLGVEYVHSRDFEAISEASKRADHARTDHARTDHIHPTKAPDDGGRASQSLIPNRADLDQAGEELRHNEQPSGLPDQRERGISIPERLQSRPSRESDGRPREEPQRSPEGAREEGKQVPRGQNMGSTPSRRGEFESWGDRLAALGEPEESGSKPGPMGTARSRFEAAQREKGDGGKKEGPRVDLTAKAVEEQVKALGVDRVEVGILRPDTSGKGKGTMDNRTMTPGQLMRALPMLKRENAQGANIYIRQASDSENRGLVMIDDLKAEMIGAMKRDGWDPAATVQTSPGNYQVWVRVPEISRPQASQLGRDLAARYQGDPASTDWRHYGRLAGFTNRKPEHMREGLAPYVTLAEATGKTARIAQEDRSALKEYLDSRISQKPSHEPIRGQNQDLSPATYGEIAKGIMRNPPRKPNGEIDQSRVDFRVAMDAFKRGMTKEAVQELLAESPSLMDRKNDPADYIERTAALAEMRTSVQPGQQIDRRQEKPQDLQQDFFGHFGR